MSPSHDLCDFTSLQERAMTLVLRLTNSGSSLTTLASSVVQTGVKSAGWENRMAHLWSAKPWLLGRRYTQAYIKLVADPLMEAFDLATACFSRKFGENLGPAGIINHNKIPVHDNNGGEQTCPSLGVPSCLLAMLSLHKMCFDATFRKTEYF